MSDTISGTGVLKRGEADFAVIASGDVVDELASKRLKAERYILVGPSAWARRDLGDVIARERIIDFDPTDQMTLRLLEKYGLRGAARSDRHFANNTDALASLVESGMGYSVLAAEFAAQQIASERLVRLGGSKHYDFGVGLAWYPRRHMPPFFRATVDAVNRHAFGLQQKIPQARCPLFRIRNVPAQRESDPFNLLSVRERRLMEGLIENQ